MRNKIDHLRDHLFETLEQLKDPDKPMDLERAQTIANVADVIVRSAKVEVDFLRVTGGPGSGFIPEQKSGTPALPSQTPKPQLTKGAK